MAHEHIDKPRGMTITGQPAAAPAPKAPVVVGVFLKGAGKYSPISSGGGGGDSTIDLGKKSAEPVQLRYNAGNNNVFVSAEDIGVMDYAQFRAWWNDSYTIITYPENTGGVTGELAPLASIAYALTNGDDGYILNYVLHNKPTTAPKWGDKNRYLTAFGDGGDPFFGGGPGIFFVAELVDPANAGGGGGGVEEAPLDGVTTYGRLAGVWVGVAEEALADGTPYARQDAGWVAALPEAPIDGTLYARQDAGWVEVPAGGGSGGVVEAAMVVITDTDGPTQGDNPRIQFKGWGSTQGHIRWAGYNFICYDENAGVHAFVEARTANAGDNGSTLATTAFVNTAITNALPPLLARLDALEAELAILKAQP